MILQPDHDPEETTNEDSPQKEKPRENTPMLDKSADSQDEPPVYKSRAGASIFSSVLNLANTMLGAGMLTIPYGFAQCGWLLAILLLFLSLVLSYFSLYVLNELGKYICTLPPNINNGKSEPYVASYSTCARVLTPKATKLIDLAITIKLLGVMVSYLIVCSDLLYSVMYFIFPHLPELLNSPQSWEVILVCTVTPLLFMSKLDSQRFSSTLALVAAGTIIGVIVTFPIWGTYPSPKGITVFQLNLRFFNVFPVFIFAFTCQQNIFSIFNEFAEGSRLRKTRIVIRIVAPSCFVIYFVVGLCGYLTLGEDIDSNILNSYPDSVIITLARIALCILITFSYPIQFHPCRVYLDGLLFGGKPSDWHRLSRHLGLTIVIIAITFTISFFVRKLDLVIGLVGATGGTLIVYILPGIFYWRAYSHTTWKHNIMKYFALGMSFLGIAIMCVSVTFIILNATVFA